MPIEITGVVQYNRNTTLKPRPKDEFDLDYVAALALAQEQAGFDRVLIANSAFMPDPHAIATFVAARTTALKLMIAHRPGVIAPTVAARLLATIDQLSQGRAGVHIIAGPNDIELQADGDFLTKEQRYERSFEYVGILRQLWAAAGAASHEGAFYRFNGARIDAKPVQRPAPPVFWGGASPAAIKYGAQCADIFALTGDSLGNTGELVDQIRAAADAAGRRIDFQITFLIITAETEEAAWAKAAERRQEFLDLEASRQGEAPDRPSNFVASNVNHSRLQKTAEEGERLDRCLWTGMNKATASRFGNQSTLVGTPDQVVAALLDYYDMGIRNVLLRGYDPLPDVKSIGEHVIPLLRQQVAARDAARAALRSA